MALRVIADWFDFLLPRAVAAGSVNRPVIHRAPVDFRQIQDDVMLKVKAWVRSIAAGDLIGIAG